MLYSPRARQREHDRCTWRFSMKRPISLALVSLAVALLAAACGGGGGTAKLGSGDVAVVGSQTVTKADLASFFTRAEKSYAANKQTFPKPGTAAYESVKSQLITYLVERAEYVQKAADMGIHVSDKQVSDAIAQAEQAAGGKQKYEQSLKAQGLTPDEAKADQKVRLIAQALYEKVTGNVKVTDKEITDYYNANKSSYQQAQSRDVRHILVPSKALADKLYAQLVADHEKNFAALAKKYSKDPGSASNGGKLTITKGQTVKPFDKTAFSLKTGELSHPVHTQYGWHIIQALSAIRPATSTPLSKEKNSIRQLLEQQKKNDVMTKWVDGTKKEFCKPGKVKYQAGFAPTPDPCASLTSPTATT
jgi:parvulin-like peptidyl-prolyl isomerase